MPTDETTSEEPARPFDAEAYLKSLKQQVAEREAKREQRRSRSLAPNKHKPVTLTASADKIPEENRRLPQERRKREGGRVVPGQCRLTGPKPLTPEEAIG